MKSADQRPIVVVIGAGAGGATTALSLAKLGCHVILLDARDQVGAVDEKKSGPEKQKSMSTSWINPGRAGHGFHYIDLTTGKMLMESTIGIHRKYPEIQVGGADPKSPLKNGLYFIEKNSLFPKEQILKVYSQLQEHYRSLVQKDPKNQVLGHPDDFFRILRPEEYQDVVDVKRVSVGIKTTERLISPTLLAQIIFEKIKEEKNITLLTKSEVTQVRYGQDKSFIVVLKDGRSIAADQVVNCAWEGMEALDQTLGLFDFSVNCTNRLKVLAVVELPPELRDQNSMFFCMGAFCMFSNCGEGTGLITYAPVTNVANYQDSKIDDVGRKFLSGNASPAEVKHYGEGIIKGVSQWIPAMAKARLITVRFGVVKTYGDVDIFNPKSAIHERSDTGVQRMQIGYTNYACMKLISCEENANLVTDLVIQDLHAEEGIKTLSQSISQEAKVSFPKLLKLCVAHYLRRNYLPEDFESSSQVNAIKKNFMKQIKNKNLLHQELLSLPQNYPVRLMIVYLSFCKIMPPAIAKIMTDYCPCDKESTVLVSIEQKRTHRSENMSHSHSCIPFLSQRELPAKPGIIFTSKSMGLINL